MMGLNIDVIRENLPLFLEGLGVTMLISVVAIPAAIMLGAIVALCRLSSLKILRTGALCYLEILRNVPFMIQVFLIYYLLPFYGFRFPAYVVGIIGLSIYASSYFSEIIRAAILSLPTGQLESARSMGMSKLQAMIHIVLPQLPPYIVPPFINQSSTLIKDTAILSTITVQELTMATQRVQQESYDFVEPLVFAAALYLAINTIMIFTMSKIKQAKST